MLILILEIIITVMGLWYLITGRTMGKERIAHRQFRYLGAFLLTLVPLLLIVGIVSAIIVAMLLPEADENATGAPLTLVLGGIEFVLAIAYAIIGSRWDRAIRRKHGPPPPPPTPMSPFPVADFPSTPAAPVQPPESRA